RADAVREDGGDPQAGGARQSHRRGLPRPRADRDRSVRSSRLSLVRPSDSGPAFESRKVLHTNRVWSTLRDSKRSGGYSFTAPAVRPWTIHLLARANSTIVGRIV